MRGDGRWDDYTERKNEQRERRVTQREERSEGTRDVEGDRDSDRVIKDRDRKD